jgi:cyclopropane fatty-acyl-phospholipid synthase-like methyltransferase
MVTDIHSHYSSPAGREQTLAAGRFAILTPASKVLDAGCGTGDGAITLAQEFRCKVDAVDISENGISAARVRAVDRGVSHLVTFLQQDILSADYSLDPYDLVLAEGGVLSFVGREKGLSLISSWLAPRGWIAFSDLIFLSDKAPEPVKQIFDDKKYRYESEASYRELIGKAGFDIQLFGLVPQSGWDNYYAHMSRKLEEQSGVFADPRIKLAFHREIDIFYRHEGFRYVGYMFCIARKRE